MDAFFNPSSIALIGASERKQSVGHQLLTHLIERQSDSSSLFFDREERRTSQEKVPKVYVVNPNYRQVLSEPSYKSILHIDAAVDLAVIAVSSKIIPKILMQCAEKGVKAALVVAAGFREVGLKGALLEQEIIRIAQQHQIRIIGTHSVGYILPHQSLNVSFLHRKPEAGNIAFVSQSGALCNAILDWSCKEHIGFSAFISLGTMIDVEWADIITYLGEDYRTKAILIYMESIGDVRKFITAAREVAFSKPIILIKAGRTAEAQELATLHSGNIIGDDRVLDAVLRRSGVLRVERIAELFLMASVLSKQGITKGKRLAILTNASGPAIVATDILIEGKGELAVFSQKTREQLAEIPASENWNILNPINLQYQATAEEFEQVTRLLLADQGSDGVLVIVSPQLHSSAKEVAGKLISLAKKTAKPLFVSVLGGEGFEQAHNQLNEAGIPSLLFPDAAVRMFNYMWRYAYNIKGLYETPSLPEVFSEDRPSPSETHHYLEEIRKQNRTCVSEYESGKLLQAYGLPVIQTELAFSEEEAVAKATEIGFPVVLKLHSLVTNEKQAVGGVRLNLRTREQVREAFTEIQDNAIAALGEEAFSGVMVQKMHKYRGLDMIVGSKTDEQFGPVLFTGHGGRIIELYEDQVIGLPPLTTTLAHRLMELTHIYHAAKAVYHLRDSLFAKLEQFMVKFSYLVTEQPLIKQININPIAVTKDELMILDVDLELHEAPEEEQVQLAIRPYPYEYEEAWVLKNEESVFARPIRPDDEPLVAEFHKTLSDQSVYLRYFYSPSFDFRVSHERLARICFVDYDREMAVVVVKQEGEQSILLAAGRTIRDASRDKAEFALTVSDHYQGTGLGTKLLDYLIRLAKQEGIKRLVADVLPENSGMLHLAKKFSFSLEMDHEEEVVKLDLVLN